MAGAEQLLEYIGFEWPPGLIQITKAGGIRRFRALDPAWPVAVYTVIRLRLAKLPGPWQMVPELHQIIGCNQSRRPAGRQSLAGYSPRAQIDVLRNCVFR